MTIIKSCSVSIQLEYADRVFLFDSRMLIFGGTPAYMFFKYGEKFSLYLTLPNLNYVILYVNDIRTLNFTKI